MITTENRSIAELQNQVTFLNRKVAEKDHTISYLEEQLAWFKRQIFGKRSERAVSDLNSQQLTFEGFENPSSEKKEKKNCCCT